LRELRAGGRLARPLQAAEHEHRRLAGGEVERVIHRPHEVDKLAMDDAHELLGGIERFEHLAADRIGRHAVEKLLDYLVGHVGLEEGGAHSRRGPLACWPR